jgi:hypothetical protein
MPIRRSRIFDLQPGAFARSGHQGVLMTEVGALRENVGILYGPNQFVRQYDAVNKKERI